MRVETGVAVPGFTAVLHLAVALGCKVTELVAVFDATELPSILPK